MADRSIVVRLKADLSDLRSKMGTAKADIASVAAASEQASKRTTAATLASGQAEKARSAARQAQLLQEIRGQEQASAAAQRYGRATAFVRGNAQDISTLGSAFTRLGIVAAAGVGVSVAAFANFDEAISHVSATGSDARANIDALRKAAIQAGADTKYSATEAAAGEEALLKAGVSAQDVLGGGLSGALNLAASGNLDVADSAEVAASAMTQFGLQGSQVPHIADLLAAAAGKAQGEVSDMGAALNQAGLVASGFGLSIEDTVGSLAAFASAGLTGSDAGTSFKTMIQRLQNPTSEAAAVLKQYNLEIYDAQGKFVGMANFAEQLRTKLSGLTDEQRNAALATIFGADAIRGANVLYKEGGAGITDWISKVNDSGFAAEQAAARMDNLKGDVEQLKGSLETDLIQSGSGANDLLRSLTQEATGAANAFGRLPNGVQQGVLGVGAFVAVAGLGVGALAKLAVGAVETKAALTALNLGSASAVMDRYGKAVGVAALALAALVAGAEAGNALGPGGRITTGVEDTTAALLKLEQTADSAALTGLFTSNKADFFSGSKDVVAGVDDIGSALDRLYDKTTSQKISDVGAGLFSWVPGAQTEMEKLGKITTDLDSSLTGLSRNGQGDLAAKAFAQLAQQATASGHSVDQLVQLFPQYRAQLQQQANALGVTTLSAQDYADWMGGKVPAAVSAAAQANPKVAQSLNLVSDATKTTTQDMQSYADALLAVSAASGGVEEAIDAASKIRGGGHDQTKAKGRSNQAALDNVGSKSADALGALKTGGASQQAIDAAAAHYRKAYRQIAESIGYSSKAARAFADDLIKTPKAVNVRVVIAGAKVSANEAAVLNHELQSIPEEKRAEIVTIAETRGAKAAQRAIAEVKAKTVEAKILGDTAGAQQVQGALGRLHRKLVDAIVRGDTSGARAVKAALDALHDKTVVARVVTKGRADSGRGLQKAGGGPIAGPGTGTSDDVPIMASNGEYMQTAAAHAYYGTQGMDAIRAMRVPRDAIAGYRDGGSIGGIAHYAKGGSVDASVVKLVGLQQAVDEARDLAELTAALKAQQKATKHLSDTQTTATDAIRQLASSLTDEYHSKSNDAGDYLEQLQQGGADLAAFAVDIKQLSQLGLSKGVIDQITAKGAETGGLDLAQGILDGGQAMVDALNQANANIEQAANDVGLAASGVDPTKPKKKVKKAYGGLIWGGTGSRADDVDVAASGGEFMVQEPVARPNLAFLTAFNAGQKVLPSYAAARIPVGPVAGSGSYDASQHYHEGTTHVNVADADIRRALAQRDQRRRDAFTLRGLTRARS